MNFQGICYRVLVFPNSNLGLGDYGSDSDQDSTSEGEDDGPKEEVDSDAELMVSSKLIPTK